MTAAARLDATKPPTPPLDVPTPPWVGAASVVVMLLAIVMLFVSAWWGRRPGRRVRTS